MKPINLLKRKWKPIKGLDAKRQVKRWNSTRKVMYGLRERRQHKRYRSTLRKIAYRLQNPYYF